MQVSGFANDFRNAADAEGHYCLFEKHRLQNAQTETLILRRVEASIGCREKIFNDGRVFPDNHVVTQSKLVDESLEWSERSPRQDQKPDPIPLRSRGNHLQEQVDPFRCS